MLQVCSTTANLLLIFSVEPSVWNKKGLVTVSGLIQTHGFERYFLPVFWYNSIMLVLCVAETQYGLESSEALVFLWNAIHCFGSWSICFHTFYRPQSMRPIHFCGVWCVVFSPGRGLMNGHFAERGILSCLSSLIWVLVMSLSHSLSADRPFSIHTTTLSDVRSFLLHSELTWMSQMEHKTSKVIFKYIYFKLWYWSLIYAFLLVIS